MPTSSYTQLDNRYGVLFYLFAGRARPIVLDFGRGGGDTNNNNTNSDNDNDNKHIVRFTKSTPKLPILKAPPAAQQHLGGGGGGGGGNNNNPTAAAESSSTTSTTIIADATMKALQRVILVDVIRRASDDPTDNNRYRSVLAALEEAEEDEEEENGPTAPSGTPPKAPAAPSSTTAEKAAEDNNEDEEYADDTIPEDEAEALAAAKAAPAAAPPKSNQPAMAVAGPNDLIIDGHLRSLMKGKDVTIMAMVPSRDCRAKAVRTAASQTRRLNPHKVLLSPNSSALSPHQQQTNVGNSSVSGSVGGANPNRSVAFETTTTNAAMMMGATRRPATANGGAGGDDHSSFVPAYMRSLRRVIVSSNRPMTAAVNHNGGQQLKSPQFHYQPALTSPSLASLADTHGNSRLVATIDPLLLSPDSLVLTPPALRGGNNNNDSAATGASPRIIGGAVYRPSSAASSVLNVSKSGAAAPQQKKVDGGAPTQQHYTADAGIFSSGMQGRIDPSNPNLMLCDSLETLLRHMSPFCFATLDEVVFRTRPSAAMSDNGGLAAYIRNTKSDGDDDKEAAAIAEMYTIPPCLLMGNGGGGGIGSGGSRRSNIKNGGSDASTAQYHHHAAINDGDAKCDAVTIRGHPLLMAEDDAYALYNFINRLHRNDSVETKVKRDRAIAEKRRAAQRLAEAVAIVTGQTSTGGGSAAVNSAAANHDFRGYSGSFDANNPTAALIHPRLFAAAETVKGSTAAITAALGVEAMRALNIHDPSVWFNVRPICPLELHMEWLSGTKLWVPKHSSAATRTGTRGSSRNGKRTTSNTSAPPVATGGSEGKDDGGAESAAAAATPSIYAEDALLRPLAPIMHPPPPLSIDKNNNGKVTMSPLRRKGQADLLKQQQTVGNTTTGGGVTTNYGNNPYYSNKFTTRGGVSSRAVRQSVAAGIREQLAMQQQRQPATAVSANPTTAPNTAEAVPNPTTAPAGPSMAIASESLSPLIPSAQQQPPTESTAVISPAPAIAPPAAAVPAVSNDNNEQTTVAPPPPLNVAAISQPQQLGSARNSERQQASSSSSSHPLLKHLLTQRIQDHMDYTTTQHEPYNRQVLWRAQLEARRILLLSFVKEFDALVKQTRAFEDVLFYKQKKARQEQLQYQATTAAFGTTTAGGGGAPRLLKPNQPRQRQPLVDPSPLVMKLRGMLAAGN